MKQLAETKKKKKRNSRDTNETQQSVKEDWNHGEEEEIKITLDQIC